MDGIKRPNNNANEAEAVVEETTEKFTAKEEQVQLRMYENDFIQGIIAAAKDKEEATETIVIKRNGVEYFRFAIHALGEEEADRCRKKHTKYKKNKAGLRYADEVDAPRFRSALIYSATSDADREKLWDNREIKQKLVSAGFNQVVSALDVIETVLNGGEKDRIIDEINKISGFNAEDLDELEETLEEEIKN